MEGRFSVCHENMIEKFKSGIMFALKGAQRIIIQITSSGFKGGVRVTVEHTLVRG